MEPVCRQDCCNGADLLRVDGSFSNILTFVCCDVGKTTLASIICGDEEATSGDVQVFGHSVLNNSFQIRRMIGLCKQDDYLWPMLSAKEHLELFAGLQGVENPNLGSVVQTWLQSVDLALPQLEPTKTFSGGMKRRLSLALATIGNKPLIILDEPTTGMDPVRYGDFFFVKSHCMTLFFYLQLTSACLARTVDD